MNHVEACTKRKFHIGIRNYAPGSFLKLTLSLKGMINIVANIFAYMLDDSHSLLLYRLACITMLNVFEFMV